MDQRGSSGQPSWINTPRVCTIQDGRIEIVTEPHTDFWQRTYYGFQNQNAPALLWEFPADFSLSARVQFQPRHTYDQCGLVLYVDDENWAKASIEYENSRFSRLGSVVTNLGYSDWATRDLAGEIMPRWYRLSRLGADFLLESSTDGRLFEQMRIFHMHRAADTVRAGVYACSPLDSSFQAVFTDMKSGPSVWRKHGS